MLHGDRGQLRLVLRPRRFGRGRARAGAEGRSASPPRAAAARRRVGARAEEAAAADGAGRAGSRGAAGGSGVTKSASPSSSVGGDLGGLERRAGDVVVDDDGPRVERRLGRQVELLRRARAPLRWRTPGPAPPRRTVSPAARRESGAAASEASAGDAPRAAPGRRTRSLALPLAPGGPRQTRSPSCSAWWPSTFSPLTNVPVALPASSIARPAGPRTTRAWKGSTLPSMIWTPASMLDPTIVSPPVRGRG